MSRPGRTDRRRGALAPLRAVSSATAQTRIARMSTVAIYKYLGVFPVLPEFARQYPEGTVTRQGILFLRQAGVQRDDVAAIAACVNEYGLRSVEIEGFSILDITALARDSNKHLTPSYEKAVQDGSALVYYGAEEPETNVVVQSGFTPSGR